MLFYRKRCEAHSKTAKEAFYLETGKILIRIIIQVRRLMYWWHINNQEETSLVKKCYNGQRLKPVKKDWVHTINKDKKDFNISLQDEDLKTIKKERFRKYLKKEAINLTLKYLNSLKIKHSKSTNLKSDELKAQEYLFDNRLNPREMKLLFQLRTRMYECKGNFEKQYEGFTFCKLCMISRDTQKHLFECYVLRNSVMDLRLNKKVKYEDIFENTDKQVEATRLLDHIIRKREILQETFDKSLN